jgi:hypothetical protein
MLRDGISWRKLKASIRIALNQLLGEKYKFIFGYNNNGVVWKVTIEGSLFYTGIGKLGSFRETAARLAKEYRKNRCVCSQSKAFK